MILIYLLIFYFISTTYLIYDDINHCIRRNRSKRMLGNANNPVRRQQAKTEKLIY